MITEYILKKRQVTINTEMTTKVDNMNMKDVLSEHNSHPRDQWIRFYYQGHRYEIGNDTSSKYTSVTTWCHTHFPKFNADVIIASIMKGKNWNPENKYWGLTAQQIKAQWQNNGAKEGTRLHSQIELFMNNGHLQKNYHHSHLLNSYQEKETESVSTEWTYFIQFIHDFPHLKPFRTEWLIYDEDLKIAGSIDMIYENEDGTLSIYDWKRSKEITKTNTWNKHALTSCISHMPDTNFWHYALQLNTYKTILERKYGRVVKELFLVRLHPDATEETYELISVPILLTEMTALLEQRLETN